jgi:hypothetical protein
MTCAGWLYMRVLGPRHGGMWDFCFAPSGWLLRLYL